METCSSNWQRNCLERASLIIWTETCSFQSANQLANLIARFFVAKTTLNEIRVSLVGKQITCLKLTKFS